MKKNPAKTEQTRQRIQNAFWDIHREKSIDKITVREVAEHAGVNRSTFYAYYKDVYDILEQSENEIITALISEHHWRSKGVLDHAQYKKDLYEIGEFFKKHKKSLLVLVGEKGDPRFSKRIWDTAWRGLRENIADISGRYDDPLLDYIVEYIINCHAGILTLWFKNGCVTPFEQIADLTYQLTAGGVLPFLSEGSNPYDKIADYILKRIKENL
ncbi:MAG: TetR/AcrR family transcriptional regulator [Oscillospiraceae bacterium]|nr:TetR/AcrR family transcriptional regulator [Oscillospiraceae bacterium]